ncbi:MAG: metallophosphoesterase [Oscillospiraceae bacterium]|nr:metallophosphoesterase [Oscillospiraceae bacterium]
MEYEKIMHNDREYICTKKVSAKNTGEFYEFFTTTGTPHAIYGNKIAGKWHFLDYKKDKATIDALRQRFEDPNVLKGNVHIHRKGHPSDTNNILNTIFGKNLVKQKNRSIEEVASFMVEEFFGNWPEANKAELFESLKSQAHKNIVDFKYGSVGLNDGAYWSDTRKIKLNPIGVDKQSTAFHETLHGLTRDKDFGFRLGLARSQNYVGQGGWVRTGTALNEGYTELLSNKAHRQLLGGTSYPKQVRNASFFHGLLPKEAVGNAIIAADQELFKETFFQTTGMDATPLMKAMDDQLFAKTNLDRKLADKRVFEHINLMIDGKISKQKSIEDMMKVKEELKEVNKLLKNNNGYWNKDYINLVDNKMVSIDKTIKDMQVSVTNRSLERNQPMIQQNLTTPNLMQSNTRAVGLQAINTPNMPTKGAINMANPTKGSTYIMSDIHGMGDMLQNMLGPGGINFSANDRLIVLGDIMDRGPQSAKVFNLLDRPNVTILPGNHEKFMLDFVEANRGNHVNAMAEIFNNKEAIKAGNFSNINANGLDHARNWLRNGGDKAVDSFLQQEMKQPGFIDGMINKVSQHIDAPYLKIQNGNKRIFAMHSDPGSDVIGKIMRGESLSHAEKYGVSGKGGIMWNRPADNGAMLREGNYSIVSGHNRTQYEYQRRWANKYNIDGGAAYGGDLICYRFEDDMRFMAHQNGSLSTIDKFGNMEAQVLEGQFITNSKTNYMVHENMLYKNGKKFKAIDEARAIGGEGLGVQLECFKDGKQVMITEPVTQFHLKNNGLTAPIVEKTVAKAPSKAPGIFKAFNKSLGRFGAMWGRRAVKVGVTAAVVATPFGGVAVAAPGAIGATIATEVGVNAIIGGNEGYQMHVERENMKKEFLKWSPEKQQAYTKKHPQDAGELYKKMDSYEKHGLEKTNPELAKQFESRNFWEKTKEFGQKGNDFAVRTTGANMFGETVDAAGFERGGMTSTAEHRFNTFSEDYAQKYPTPEENLSKEELAKTPASVIKEASEKDKQRKETEKQVGEVKENMEFDKQFMPQDNTRVHTAAPQLDLLESMKTNEQFGDTSTKSTAKSAEMLEAFREKWGKGLIEPQAPIIPATKR